MSPEVFNGGHGCVPPQRPVLEQVLVSPVVGSECPRSSGGKRVAPVYVGELHGSAGGLPRWQSSEHWYGLSEDLVSIPGLGLLFFHIYL